MHTLLSEYIYVLKKYANAHNTTRSVTRIYLSAAQCEQFLKAMFFFFLKALGVGSSLCKQEELSLVTQHPRESQIQQCVLVTRHQGTEARRAGASLARQSG